MRTSLVLMGICMKMIFLMSEGNQRDSTCSGGKLGWSECEGLVKKKDICMCEEEKYVFFLISYFCSWKVWLICMNHQMDLRGKRIKIGWMAIHVKRNGMASLVVEMVPLLSLCIFWLIKTKKRLRKRREKRDSRREERRENKGKEKEKDEIERQRFEKKRQQILISFWSDLSANNLKGSIPSSLGNLQNLSTLLFGKKRETKILFITLQALTIVSDISIKIHWAEKSLQLLDDSQNWKICWKYFKRIFSLF